MATDTPELPIQTTAGNAGSETVEAFALLADETRLSVLLALWETYDPRAADSAVPFSEIFERVEYDDPGNLRYHLEKLEGQFVEHRAPGEGYELRTTGLKFVRSVVAGAGVQDATLDTTEIEQPCPFCDAPTAISYRDGLVIHACTACDGARPDTPETEGILSVTPFYPAGLTDRSPEEVRAASTVAALRGAQTLFDGLCPACSGAVDGWFEYCSDHDPAGGCENCQLKFAARARFQCRVCRNHKVEPAQGLAMFHPAVISFYDDHGVSTRISADDVETVTRLYELMDGHRIDVVAEQPVRVDVTATFDTDEIRVTFDDTVSVVDVRR